MCDFATQNRTEEIINEFITSNTMFSAFDVTYKLREEGFKVYHSEIRNIVRNMFNNDLLTNYSRTLINIDNTQTFIYHGSNSDPYTYNKDWQVKKSISTDINNLTTVDDNNSSLSTPINIKDNTDNTNIDSIIVHRTKEGRFEIPKKLIDKIRDDISSVFAENIFVVANKNNDILNVIPDTLLNDKYYINNRDEFYDIINTYSLKNYRVRISSYIIEHFYNKPISTVSKIKYEFNDNGFATIIPC